MTHLKRPFLFGVTVFGLFLGLPLGILLGLTFTGAQEVLFESKESKSVLGGPVFNKIKWIPGKDKDVWMMKQGHHGPHQNESSWDRLAIVVDKTRSPKTVRYYQLETGTLEWSDDVKETSFRVSCFMCHNNGPRAIRANYDSPLDPTSFSDRLRIAAWNLRIKLYGRVKADILHDFKDLTAPVPFRFRSSYENEVLKVEGCAKCHNEDGFLARGSLRRQQFPTIQFMLESGAMPPMGHSLSRTDKEALQKFLSGF